MKESIISRREKEVTEAILIQNSLDSRYKRVIDELRRQRNWWKKNAWKSLIVNIINKIMRKEMI
jgi:hypothetical protein